MMKKGVDMAKIKRITIQTYFSSLNRNMHVLFLALTIYLLGATLVLYTRPSIMFHPGGKWKEFSLNPDANHTFLPFWLFSILWAFMSYLLASVIQRYLVLTPSHEMQSEVIENEIMEDVQPSRNSHRRVAVNEGINYNENLDMDTDMGTDAEPVSKSMGINVAKNGFYVLNTEKYAKNKTPMYIYYGDKPPVGYEKS